MNILRFYGSCGHIENKEISNEEFEKWSTERIVKSIFGDYPHKNEITLENGSRIVHVVPFRWCSCEKCMMEDMKEFE